MSDPRLIPADDAKVTLDAVNQAIGDGFSFPDTYVRDLAYTVIEQAAQIERLHAALREADRRASTEPGATWEEDYPMLNEEDMDDDKNNR